MHILCFYLFKCWDQYHEVVVKPSILYIQIKSVMTSQKVCLMVPSHFHDVTTKTNISVELVRACVVLDMFKTFIRSGKSVVQLLKNEVLYYYNTRV